MSDRIYLGCMRHMWDDDQMACPACADELERSPKPQESVREFKFTVRDDSSGDEYDITWDGRCPPKGRYHVIEKSAYLRAVEVAREQANRADKLVKERDERTVRIGELEWLNKQYLTERDENWTRALQYGDRLEIMTAERDAYRAECQERSDAYGVKCAEVTGLTAQLAEARKSNSAWMRRDLDKRIARLERELVNERTVVAYFERLELGEVSRVGGDFNTGINPSDSPCATTRED